jgi:hypothetical protein
MSGTITFTDNSTAPAPATFTPPPSAAGDKGIRITFGYGERNTGNFILFATTDYTTFDSGEGYQGRSNVITVSAPGPHTFTWETKPSAGTYYILLVQLPTTDNRWYNPDRGIPNTIPITSSGETTTGLHTDDFGSKGEESLPENVPNLPSGVAYVTNETEAIALLTALKPDFSSVMDQVHSLIWDGVADVSKSGGWDITDTTSIPGLFIGSRVSVTDNSNPDNFMDDGWSPAVGHNRQMSWSDQTILEFTTKGYESGVVVYGGSWVLKYNGMAASYEVKNISSGNATIHMNGSNEYSDLYTLTASSGGKGGKVILDTSERQSANVDFTYPGNSPQPPATYSGSLKVYGDNDQVRYTLNITNAATYQQAMDYFD